MKTSIFDYKLNQDTTGLKLIAVALMIVDHTGAVFFPRLTWMRVVGRIAFPLFAYCVAVGVRHTRNIWRYGLRFAGLYVISQPLYMLALSHTLWQMNIFATLLLGLIACAGIRFRKEWLAILTLALALYLSSNNVYGTAVTFDYAFRGVAVIFVMYMTVNDPPVFTAVFSLFCVAWSESLRLNISSFPFEDWRLTLSWGSSSMFLTRAFGQVIRLQTAAILALPFILFPKKERMTPKTLRIPDKALYFAYPAHLLVLYIIKILVR